MRSPRGPLRGYQVVTPWGYLMGPHMVTQQVAHTGNHMVDRRSVEPQQLTSLTASVHPFRNQRLAGY
jgi:hypothetical protein